MVQSEDFEIIESWKSGIHVKSKNSNSKGEATISNAETKSNVYVFKLAVDVSCPTDDPFILVRIIQIIESTIDNFYSRDNKSKAIKRAIYCGHCINPTTPKKVTKFFHQDLVDKFVCGISNVVCDEGKCQIKINSNQFYSIFFCFFFYNFYFTKV